MNTIATERSLLEALYAYARNFEMPKSYEELKAITSSILTFQEKQGSFAIAPDRVESLIQQVIEQFDVEKIATFAVDTTTETLTQQVHQWQESLERQVLETLNAYAQKFQPQKILDLREIILSIIPLVEDAPLRRTEAESLIQRVQSKFDWQTALGQVIGAEPLAIAQKLAQLLQHGKLEESLKETVAAYQQGINQTLETVTESLVKTALKKILGNTIQFDIDTDIDLESQKLLIKQVTLKLNLMQPSLQPSKSAQEIANQMQQEIDIFKALQREKFGEIDLTKPSTLGDLQVGISTQEGGSIWHRNLGN